MASTETEVLVVGAGPTGLTLAAALLRQGVRVRIIDRAERASPHSRAITLWPRALEAFDTFGAGQEMFDLGVRLAATSYYTGNRKIGRVPMRPLAGTRFPVPVSLPQVSTERVLRETVEREGGKIEFGRELVALDQDDDGVTARLDDDTEIRAGWIAGCDGAHSTVRARSGVAFTGSTYPQTFAIVDGEFVTDYAHQESYYLMGPTGVIVVVGLPGGQYRAFASLPPGEAAPADVEATVRAILGANSPLRMDLVRASGNGIFQIHRKLVDRMRIGRVLLAGDAAHIHSPAGGLGLNTGVQDAVSLAWRLAGVLRAEQAESTLDGWAAERLFVAQRVLADTDQQTRLWLLSGWRKLLRDVLIEVGLRTRVVERVLPRRMAQLDLVLPVSGPGCGRLVAGSRAPDAALGDGRRLHDLLRPGTAVLLVFDQAPETLRAVLGLLGVPVQTERIADPDGRVRRALRAPRLAACLIRPDGIVAGAAGPGSSLRTTQQGEN